MTVISSRNTGQSALIDMAGDIANDAVRLSERHRKVKGASRLLTGGTVGVVAALSIMGVWSFFTGPSASFRSLDVPTGLIDAAREASAGVDGTPFQSIFSLVFTGMFPTILMTIALIVGLAVAVVRQTLAPLLSAGAIAFALFVLPQIVGTMGPASESEGSTATVTLPEKPSEWEAWLKAHPKEANTDAGRYLDAQIAYLTKSGTLRGALSTWPGSASAASEIDASRVVIMEQSAFKEARSAMAKAKLADYQHTRARLRAASSSALLWLAALLGGTLVTRRLRRTMGARVDSAMHYLASRKANA